MTDSFPLCDRCQAETAWSNELSVVGPLDIREDWYCQTCNDEMVANAQRQAQPTPAGMARLGPIDFDVLRASIKRNEADPNIARDQIAMAAPILREVADAHGQTLPDDIEAFVARYAIPRSTDDP